MRILGRAGQSYLGRGVVPEVRGVDDDPADHAGEGKPEYHVVVAAVAPPPGLPALAHGAGPVRADEVTGRRVEVVAAGHDRAAVLLAGQVDGQVLQPARVRDHPAEHAEPGDPAVRVGGQPQVGEPAAVRDPEDVLAVPGQGRPRDDLLPAGELVLAGIALASAGLDADGRRVVPGEEARVHVDRGDDARGAEPDDGPVVAGRPPAPGLPAVDDLAAGTVVPG